MKGKWLLAMALTLACGVCANAGSIQTTQVTLVAPYGGLTDVTGLVNGNGGTGSGLSYTVSASSAIGTPVYATGAMDIASYKLYDGTTGTFQTASIVLTYALEGTQVAPVGGAAVTADFTKGVFAIYAVPSFNPQKESTWGTTSGTFLYSATLGAPAVVVKGPLGDTAFAGQGIPGQNQASFFPSTSVTSDGAFLVNTLDNTNKLFAPPQPFTGFQGEVHELNALGANPDLSPTFYSSLSGYPTNADLDANFSALAALDPGLGLTTGQFTADNYSGTANTYGPSTLQEIGGTFYPVVPEPASIILLSVGAIGGMGIFVRRQKKALPTT